MSVFVFVHRACSRPGLGIVALDQILFLDLLAILLGIIVDRIRRALQRLSTHLVTLRSVWPAENE